MSNHHDHDHDARPNRFALVFFINLSFTIIEIVGGLLTNSIAIISDALHDFGDTLSLGLSWYMEKVAQRKSDRTFSFGYKRFSLLAALLNGVVLLAGTVFVLLEAVPRLFNPESVHVNGMLGLAVLGIVVNGFAALKLRGAKSISESVLSLHLLEDVLGWVAVLVVGIAMKLGDFVFLDPVLSIILACFIIWNAVKRIKKTLKIFLQSIPDDVDVPGLEKSICLHSLVCNVHDTHVWSLDGTYHVLTTHVVIPKATPDAKVLELKNDIRKKIAEFDIQHATLEIEYEGDACVLENCR